MNIKPNMSSLVDELMALRAADEKKFQKTGVHLSHEEEQKVKLKLEKKQPKKLR